MPRKPRCIEPGVPYHVTQRGVDRTKVFLSRADRLTYLGLFEKNLEDTGVSAYNGALPEMFTSGIIELAAQIVQVEARHAALVRDFLGKPITEGAFDKPLDEPRVSARIKPYVVG